MVRAFAARGHTVLGCGRSSGKLDQSSREFGEPHRFRAVDVASDEAVAAWARECLSVNGPPDLLLNNAGVINRTAPLWEITAAEFSSVLDVNVKGAANVIRHFVPAMVRRMQGIVVNFSSGWGRSADAQVAPYCASKWAIEGMTLALAQELPDGMAAVALNPGIINTEMLRSCFGRSATGYPTAEEWAEIAVPFLLNLRPSDNGGQLTVPIRGATD
jgi:NAD(P)-dependent dehydrogenase (short-subunit alcohol dehydrogenase family)